MQLKRFPGDFRVRELADLQIGKRGDYWVHRLSKEKLDTLEAIAIVAREAGVPRADIAFAGLKDRQGVTEQFITIKGARADFRKPGLTVRSLGKVERPITSKASRGNAFEIVVRGLDRRGVERFEQGIANIAECGFANYFDDQRFNCLRHGQGFVMKQVLVGRFDRALKQLLASPSRMAKTGDVELKKLLDAHWGDWARCGRVARGPVFARVFGHLERQPDDFAGALAHVPTRIKLIHAFAFQSHMWNRAVSKHLEKLVAPGERTSIETEAGTYVGWRQLDAALRDSLRAEATPLYGPGGEGGSRPFVRAMGNVLREVGLTAESFLANRVPGMALKEEARAQLVVPVDLKQTGIADDEANRGKTKIRLTFELPRGSYATLLLKCIEAPAWRRPARASDREPVRERPPARERAALPQTTVRERAAAARSARAARVARNTDSAETGE